MVELNSDFADGIAEVMKSTIKMKVELGLDEEVLPTAFIFFEGEKSPALIVGLGGAGATGASFPELVVASLPAFKGLREESYKKLGRYPHATHAILSTEVWISSATSVAESGKRPSEDPNHLEAVMLMVHVDGEAEDLVLTQVFKGGTRPLKLEGGLKTSTPAHEGMPCLSGIILDTFNGKFNPPGHAVEIGKKGEIGMIGVDFDEPKRKEDDDWLPH
jgi:hypothetical protein